jgi:DNA-binding LacI/PurR family transcriptional regulator
MSPRTPTLEEIAAIAGVSRSTVSRVVNDEPNVRAEVRQRVWRVVDEMGYHPNAAARSLVSRRTQTLGIVIPETVSTVFVDPFFPNVLRGLADAALAAQPVARWRRDCVIPRG